MLSSSVSVTQVAKIIFLTIWTADLSVNVRVWGFIKKMREMMILEMIVSKSFNTQEIEKKM